MAITSSSTFDEVMAQANNNLAWEGSPTKAAALLEAVRWLRLNRARLSQRQASQLMFEDLGATEKALAAYVSSTTAAATNRRSFTKGRTR